VNKPVTASPGANSPLLDAQCQTGPPRRSQPTGHVQGGQVTLDDAASVTTFDQVRDAAEQAFPVAVVYASVAGVGAQRTDVFLGVIRLFLQVAASLHVAEQARNLDPAYPIRHFIGSRTPFVVVRTHDLGRLPLVDPLCGLEEALAASVWTCSFQNRAMALD
jgi:hypothetical protein